MAGAGNTNWLIVLETSCWRRRLASHPAARAAGGDSGTIGRAAQGRCAGRPAEPPSNEPFHRLEQHSLLESALEDIGAGADIDAALAILARSECRHQHH